MVMSRDPSCKFDNFQFSPAFTFSIRKVTKFPVEKFSTSEVISQKPHGGVPFKVNICHILILSGG